MSAWQSVTHCSDALKNTKMKTIIILCLAAVTNNINRNYITNGIPDVGNTPRLWYVSSTNTEIRTKLKPVVSVTNDTDAPYIVRFETRPPTNYVPSIDMIKMTRTTTIPSGPIITNKVTQTNWMNDSVYYWTNHVMDDSGFVTNTSGVQYFYRTKDVVTTNKVSPTRFPSGGGHVEIGFREDGVVVWRKAK